jgi:uncharacterized protein (DUF302 family)
MKRITNLWPIAAGLVIGIILTVSIAAWQMPQQVVGLMINESQSPHDMVTTLARIEKNAIEMGWQVAKTYDFRESIRKHIGKDVGPVKVMEMCQPGYATRMLSKDLNKRLAVMMPCAIAVYDKADGKTYVARMNMELISQEFPGDVGEVLGAVARDDARILGFAHP